MELMYYMIEKVKENIGFHYLLTEIKLYSFGIEYIPPRCIKQNQR